MARMLRPTPISDHLRCRSTDSNNSSTNRTTPKAAKTTNGSAVSSHLRRHMKNYNEKNHSSPSLEVLVSSNHNQYNSTSSFKTTIPRTVEDATVSSSFSWMASLFLERLRTMLDDAEKERILTNNCNPIVVSWNADGRSFQVRNKFTFALEITPLYLKIMSYSTFQRVMESVWGFQCIRDDGSISSNSNDIYSGIDTYSHPRFVRGQPSLYQNLSAQEMKNLGYIGAFGSLSSSSALELQKIRTNGDYSLRSHLQRRHSKFQVELPRRLSGIDNGFDHKTRVLYESTIPNKSITAILSSDCQNNTRNCSALIASEREGREVRKVDPITAMYWVDQAIQASASTTNLTTTTTIKGDILKKHRQSLQRRTENHRNLLQNQKVLSQKEKQKNQNTKTAESTVNKDKTTTATTSNLTWRNENFTEDLRGMLNGAEKHGNDYIVSWMPNGSSFKVHKENQFVESILPIYISKMDTRSTTTKTKSQQQQQQSEHNLKCFKRKLDEYGFYQMRKGPDSGSYYHPLFCRNDPSLCRNKTKKQMKLSGWKKAGTFEPNLYLTSSTSSKKN